MPVVQVQLKDARSLEEKRELIRRITDVLVEVCGSVEERVHVIIDEVPEQSWGRGGSLLSDIAEAAPPKQAAGCS